MSSCLAILFDDCIYMSSDGAECTIRNGKRYRSKDNVQKLNVVHDKNKDYLMFMCGASIIIGEIRAKYLNSTDKSVFSLSEISKNTYAKYKDFLEEYPEKDRGIEIFLACQDTGRTVLNVINNENNFNAEQITASTQRILISGCNKEEIKKDLNKYCSSSNSAMDLYLKVYSQSGVISEAVGGQISVYKLFENKAQYLCDFKVPRYLEENIQRIKAHKSYLVNSKNGNYTEFNPDDTGFKWHKSDGITTHDYHYLCQPGYAIMPPFTGSGTGFRAITIHLGDEFKGKKFYVLPSLRSFGTTDGTPRRIYGEIIQFFEGDMDYANAKFTLHAYVAFEDDFNTCNLEISYIVVA